MNRITLLALMTILATGAASEPVSGPAGVYTVTVTTTGPTRITRGDGWYKIEWEVGNLPAKPDPPAKPEPPPEKPEPPPVVTPPAPQPAPPVSVTPLQAGPAWIAAVYDEAKSKPDWLNSKTIGPALEARKITWSVWKASDFAGSDWGADIAGKSLPLILVMSNRGLTSAIYPLPADGTAMLSMADKLRGQN